MLLCHLTGDVNLGHLVPVVSTRSPHNKCLCAFVIDKLSMRKIFQDCVITLFLTTFHQWGFVPMDVPWLELVTSLVAVKQ